LKSRTEQLFAVTAPGLEEVCALELRSLGMADVCPVAGGVEFSGALREIYLANLRLRSASRVLVRVDEFRCRDFPELYRKTLRLPWGRFLRGDTALQVRASSQRSRLVHSGRIADTLTEAVNRSLGRPSAPVNGPQQLVLVRCEDDLCQLSVDSSGALLHRRGYRTETAFAPLRETLAAGILLLLGWDGTTALADPLCGSGTFLIEGALMASNRAPGLDRDFAFMDWPGFRSGLWDVLRQEAAKDERSGAAPLWGGERETTALDAAKRNAERAGVAELVHLQQLELEKFFPPPGPGLVVCNPPYGKRVGRDEDLRPLFKTLGSVFRSRFAGWQGAFICPDDRLARATGLPLKKVALLHNGGIPVSLWTAEL